MARVCLKCNYERTPNELVPETERPQCGAIYAKIEKALRPPEAVPPLGWLHKHRNHLNKKWSS